MMDKLNRSIFLIEDNELLEKCNTTWDKANTYINKEFFNKTAYNKNILKTKIKSYSLSR